MLPMQPRPQMPAPQPAPAQGELPPGITPQMLLMMLLKLLGPQMGQGGAMAPQAAPPMPGGAPAQGGQPAPLIEALRNIQRLAASRSLQGMAGQPPTR